MCGPAGVGGIGQGRDEDLRAKREEFRIRLKFARSNPPVPAQLPCPGASLTLSQAPRYPSKGRPRDQDQ